jgi:hypothetical protein
MPFLFLIPILLSLFSCLNQRITHYFEIDRRMETGE